VAVAADVRGCEIWNSRPSPAEFFVAGDDGAKRGANLEATNAMSAADTASATNLREVILS
jgi:hypothetical protein